MSDSISVTVLVVISFLSALVQFYLAAVRLYFGGFVFWLIWETRCSLRMGNLGFLLDGGSDLEGSKSESGCFRHCINGVEDL